MLPTRLHFADDETEEATNRCAAGRCQEGARCNCRGAEAQEYSNRCSTSRQSTGSVVHREQQLHRRPLGHRTSGRLAGRRSPSRATNQACKAYSGGLISCSSSRLWYRPAVSGPFPPQLLHPHRTGAVEPATAAAPAAPDGATETGGSHPTVRLPAPPAGKPRARAAALCLPMCAPIRTPRTHNLHPTALWGRLLRRLRLR